MKFNFLTSKKDSFLKSWFKSALFFALIISLVLSSSFTYSATNYIPLNKKSALVYTFLGSGTETSPYLIASANDLKNFGNNVNLGTNYSGKYFKLIVNINLDNVLFNPIGYSNYYSFQGTFDGDNHIIEGLNVNSAKQYAGLFGYVRGATIKNIIVSGNVAVQDTTSASNSLCCAGIAATASSSSFYNCSNWCTITNNTSSSYYCNAGGISGSDSSSTYELCKNLGNVTANNMYNNSTNYNRAGGISGYSSSSSTFSKCCNYGTIKAGNASYAKHSYAGGIVGTYAKTVTNCYNVGEVTSMVLPETSKTKIRFTLSDSSTSYGSRILSSSTELLNNSSVNSTQTAYNDIIPKNISVSCVDTNQAYAGGICGDSYYKSQISQCYNKAKVTGGAYKVEVSSSFIFQYMIPSSGYYEYNTTNVTELWLDFNASCDVLIYYSSMSGGKSFNTKLTDCYYCNTPISNQNNTIKCTIEKLYWCSYTKTFYGISSTEKHNNLDNSRYTYTKSDTGISPTVSWDRSEFNEIGYINGEKQNYYTYFQTLALQAFMDDNNYLNINITMSKWTSGWGAWKLTTKYNTNKTYNLVSDASIGVNYLTSNTIPSGFSSDIWAINPSINNGYPYLKEMYWQ